MPRRGCLTEFRPALGPPGLAELPEPGDGVWALMRGRPGLHCPLTARL